MARWFQAGTSPEGTAAWRDILAAVSHVLTGETVGALPLVITYGLPIDLAPGGEWPDEPKVADFLQDVRPLIAQIEQAGKYPTPVWQPLAFHGLATWLPGIAESHLVMRLLSLEVKHALYRRDTERALRGLAAMQATAAAFDWDCFFVTDLYGLNLRDFHRDAIRRSLASTDWEPAQVDQLLGQLDQPRDVARRWHRIAAGEREGAGLDAERPPGTG